MDAKFDTAAAVLVVSVMALCPATMHWSGRRARSSTASCAGPIRTICQGQVLVGRTGAPQFSSESKEIVICHNWFCFECSSTVDGATN